MTKWARVSEGAVVELTDRDPAGRYHPSLTWVQVPAPWEALVAPGCSYGTGQFGPPRSRDPETSNVTTDPDMEWLRRRALTGVRDFASAARQAITKTNDPIEVASWPSKEQMALRYQADEATSSDTAALTAEAVLRDQTVEDLAALIVAKAAAYKPATGKVDGWRKQAEQLIATTNDPTELVTQLAALKASAAAELEIVAATVDPD